jgi:Skp family chaperone for outer membrane proteins
MSQRKVVFCAGGLIAGSAFLAAVIGNEAERLFRPPRVAVVDISAVFEDYGKKKDRQDELQKETKTVEDKLKDLEKRYKEINAELGNLEAGPSKNEKLVEKVKLEIDVKELKERELKRLEETTNKYLQEIRDEISAEIQTMARSLDVDIVFEKTVAAAREGPRWPIIHYVKPELDITKEVLDRLNARYTRR